VVGQSLDPDTHQRLIDEHIKQSPARGTDRTDMAEKDALVRGYAEALFAVADAEGELEAVEDQLYAFAKAVEGNAELREAVTDPALPAENKKGVVRDLLGERANPHTVNVLGFLIDQGRAREIGRIVEELASLAAERRAHVVAEVRRAVPLDETQRRRLAEALSRATGREVESQGGSTPPSSAASLRRWATRCSTAACRTRLVEARGS
jgi:F-type H+-transporting ATPase subunit delta